MQGTNTKINEKIGAGIVFSQECKSVVCQYGQEIVYLLQKWLHDACLLAKEVARLPALTSFPAALVLPRYMIKLIMLYTVEYILVVSTN